MHGHIPSSNKGFLCFYSIIDHKEYWPVKDLKATRTGFLQKIHWHMKMEQVLYIL